MEFAQQLVRTAAANSSSGGPREHAANRPLSGSPIHRRNPLGAQLSEHTLELGDAEVWWGPRRQNSSVRYGHGGVRWRTLGIIGPKPSW